jgi:hypothetical protein
LFVLDAAARVAPHPQPEARAGRTIAMQATGERLWQLRADGDSGQLMQVSASTLERRFADSPHWDSFAATDERVQLVRLSGGGMLEQLLLSPDGEELSRSAVLAPEGSVAAFARMTGALPYVVLLVQAGLAYELGRIEGDAFVALHRAPSIAGPVELASGERFVAVGGRLASFEDEQVEMLDGPAIVTCLERTEDRAYACADGGLRALAPEGLGAVWFSLDQLSAPEGVPDEHAQACELQWQRFRIDLLAAGVELDATLAATDAGADASAADAGSGDASDNASEPAPGGSSGCACRAQPRTAGRSGWMGVLGLCAFICVARLCRCGHRARPRDRLGGQKWSPPDRNRRMSERRRGSGVTR